MVKKKNQTADLDVEEFSYFGIPLRKKVQVYKKCEPSSVTRRASEPHGALWRNEKYVNVSCEV